MWQLTKRKKKKKERKEKELDIMKIEKDIYQ